MNKLIIDTSDNLVTRVALIKNGKEYKIDEKRKAPGDQNVLELISKLLRKHKLKLKDFSSIDVETSPGSFTGLRVGASIANALSFALGIPVNSKKIGEIVVPQYPPKK